MDAPTVVLPAFDHPPVVEVAVGVEFAPNAGLDAFRLSDLRSRWAAQYPKAQVQPVLPPNPPTGFFPGFEFSFGGFQSGIRVWLLSQDENHLVQVQNDRLFLNWRKLRTTPNEANYPHYESIKENFAELWHDLTDWLSGDGIPVNPPLIAEVTYINYVPLETATPWDVLAPVHPPVGVPGEPVFVGWGHVSSLSAAASAGQVSINANQASDENGPFLNITVTTRLGFDRTADKDVLDQLDEAHRSSVTAFEAVTTRDMHTLWGKR